MTLLYYTIFLLKCKFQCKILTCNRVFLHWDVSTFLHIKLKYLFHPKQTQLCSTEFLLINNNRNLVACHFACVYTFLWVYVNLSSSSSIPHCIVSHQCWLISCFDPVCLHVPAVDGDDDRCFKWHFSANNLLSYWFPAQISCSALFQQMDFVPCCPSPHPSSFLMFLYFTE